MKTIEEIDALAKVLMQRDNDRDKYFDHYDKMYHGDWALPNDMAKKQWMFAIISTEPADKINAATKVLARLEPSVSVPPLSDDPDTKQKANERERVLKAQLVGARKRKPESVWWEYTKSALMYDMVAGQVIDLEYQVEQQKNFEINDIATKAALRYGRFMLPTYHPKLVHPRYSNVMPEGVLLCTTKPAFEVYKEFGPKLAKGLKEWAYNKEDIIYVTLYDWTDYEARCVWCVQSDGNTSASQTNKDRIVIVDPQELPFPFMNWVIRSGGSSLEDVESEKYKPLLYTIDRSGYWEMANVINSIVTSTALATSGLPKLKEEGLSAVKNVTINTDDPLAIAKVPPGDTLDPLVPPPLDPNMLEQRNWIKSRMDSALPQVLQTMQPETNEPYANFNLRWASALGSLASHQKLAEQGLSDACELFELWAHYTKKDLLAYGTSKEDMGKNYVIPWNEIDPQGICVEVSLTPDAPTDRVTKINAASQAYQILGLSREEALESVGFTDPQTLMKNRAVEDMIQHKLDMVKQREIVEMQLWAEAQRAQFQMAVQQAQAQQAQAQQQADVQANMDAQQAEQEMATQQSQNMAGPQGIPGVEGQGYNPAQGGTIPAQVNPEATREMQNGQAIEAMEALR